MRKLVKLAVLLVVLIVAAAGAAFIYIDSIARRGIEVASTAALGVNTTLNTADVGILSGTFDMAGLNVSNPGGFQSPHFLALGDGGVAVSLGSLNKPTVELPYLKLSGIDVNLERRENKSNYQVILDHVKSLETGGGTSKPSGGAGGAEKKFIIREVKITDINIHVDLLPIGGPITKVNVPISEITLRDIGSGTDGGMVLRELVPTLLKAILAAAVQKGGEIIPADVLGELQGSLAQLKSLESLGVNLSGDLQRQAGEIGKGVQDAADKARKAAEDVGKGLKDLIPKP